MPLSEEEDGLLWELGTSFLHSIVQLTTYVFWHGLFVLLFAISVVLTARRGILGLPAKVMFGATVVSFILGTLTVGSQIAGFVVFVRHALLDSIGIPLDARPSIVNKKLFSTNILNASATCLPPLIGDIIVVWRAWVMFPDQQWVIVLPCMLWLGSFGITVTILGLINTPFGYYAYFEGDSGKIPRLVQAGTVMSIGTNVCGTLLIAYKLWSHRRLVSKTLGPGSRQTPVQKIFIILIESGIIYFALQLTYAVLALWAPGPQGSVSRFIDEIFEATYDMISAMYPTIILVLVHLRRSIDDLFEFSTQIGADTRTHRLQELIQRQPEGTLEPLTFAVGPVRTDQLNHDESSGPVLVSDGKEREKVVDSSIILP